MKEKIKLKISYFRHSICMMLDDTRCGLDTSSLHRDTSIDISLYKKFELLSCYRDTLYIFKTYKNGLEIFSLSHQMQVQYSI